MGDTSTVYRQVPAIPYKLAYFPITSQTTHHHKNLDTFWKQQWNYSNKHTMQKACCQVFAVLVLLALVLLLSSLWHVQADTGQFWSHRCHREGELENDLDGCKAALEVFDGIEVDVRWNGVEVWNNESFWLHHDNASLSGTRLVDLLEMVQERYQDKKVYLDCKFKDVSGFATVAGYLLTTVGKYKLLDRNVFIQWNRDVQVSSPYWTVSSNGKSNILVETFWNYWFKYWWGHPEEYTIVFTQNAFETMLWLLPCLPQSMFDDGVEVMLWKSWDKYECEGVYPSLFAWKWLFYTLLLGVAMECVVVVWAAVVWAAVVWTVHRRNKEQYVLNFFPESC